MKNRWLGILMLVLFTGVGFGADKRGLGRGSIGIGFQRITWNCWGISAMIDWTPAIATEGLIGVLGDRQAYAIRGLVRPFYINHFNLYGYGIAGMESCGEYDGGYYIEETGLLLGAGCGVEYDTGKIIANFASLSLDLEVGIESMSLFQAINANYFTVTFGVGFHIRIF